MGLSVTQLLVIFAIVLVLFGSRKLRNLGGDLGSAIKSFRTAMSDPDEISDSSVKDEAASSPEGQVIEGEVSAEEDKRTS